MSVAPHRPLSLKARAVQWLAMREYSRLELRRKLLAHLAKVERLRQVGPADTPRDGCERLGRGDGAHEPTPVSIDTGASRDLGSEAEGHRLATVEALLDDLARQGLLSDARFASSRVRVRAPKLGTRRIEAELASLGVEASAHELRELRETELQRAQAVWTRKFHGRCATTPMERARQQRFMAARGFSADVIRRIVSDPL